MVLHEPISQDIPLNFAPKNPNIDSMCFLLARWLKTDPLNPQDPEAKAACASRNASRKAQHAFSYHWFDLTLRGTKSSHDVKNPPEVKAELLLKGGLRFFKGMIQVPRKSKTWRWHNCGGWSHLLHMKPLWKKWRTGFFLPKRDEEGCSSSNLGGDWHPPVSNKKLLEIGPSFWVGWNEAKFETQSIERNMFHH